MKRFTITFTFLLLGLLLTVCGVDRGLDSISRAPSSNCLTVYDATGRAVMVYHGGFDESLFSPRNGSLLIHKSAGKAAVRSLLPSIWL